MTDVFTSDCAPYSSSFSNRTTTFMYAVKADPESIIRSILLTETGGIGPDSEIDRTFSIRSQNGSIILQASYSLTADIISSASTNNFYNGLTSSIVGNTVIIDIIGNSITNGINNIITAAGDHYIILLLGCESTDGAQVTLTRKRRVGGEFGNFLGAGGGFNNGFIGFTGGCSGCACFTNNSCGNIRVPIVSISGQTTFDGEYLADMLFIICDQFQYYKCKPLKSCCKINFVKSELLLQTQFRTCGIKLENVVKGPNNLSLREKLILIYNQFSSILGPSFNAFYENFILYGMAKYILSRVLYGDFNLNYLLKSFNKEFLYDLGNSRFCAFLELFEDCNSNVYGFNQFFKSGNKQYSESIYNFREVNRNVRNINKDCGCK